MCGDAKLEDVCQYLESAVIVSCLELVNERPVRIAGDAANIQVLDELRR